MEHLKDWLQIIANGSAALAALAGIGAAFFVSLQVAHMKRSREVDTFLRIIDIANNADFRRAAYWVKTRITPETSYEETGQKEHREHTSLIINYFEMVGNLVNHSYISRDLIYDQMGSWIVGTWEKLKIIIAAHRAAKNSPQYAENFEILAIGYDRWAKRNPAKLDRRPRATGSILSDYYAKVALRKPKKRRRKLALPNAPATTGEVGTQTPDAQ